MLSSQYIHKKSYEKWSLNIPRVSLIIRLVGNIKRLKIIRFDLSLFKTEGRGDTFIPLIFLDYIFFSLWGFNPNVPIFLRLTKIGLLRLVNLAQTLTATMVIFSFFQNPYQRPIRIPYILYYFLQ